MITKNNLQQLLLNIGFTVRKSVFSKTFGTVSLEIEEFWGQYI